MAPFPRWADLPTELFCHIGDHLDNKGYAGARGACTAWRRALVPLSPTLLVLGADKKDAGRCRPYAASLPTRRSLELTAIDSGSRFVGSSNGWLAFSVVNSSIQAVIVLLNPLDAVEILLPPLVYNSRLVSKVVVAPSPAKDDFAAAAICDKDMVAYVTAGARRWAIMEVRLTARDHLTDVVYNDNDKAVYYLTKFGDVHVLRLPERRLWKAAADNDDVDEAEAGRSVPPEISVLPPPQSAQAQGTIHLQRRPHQRNLWMMNYGRLSRAPSESQGPHLNFPATIEPLLSAKLPFNRATVFAPPYNTVSSFTTSAKKNLVFCEGNLYQVWRDESCTVTLQLPAGGRRGLVENEMLVLRYYPKRQPCWDVVKDLGGHSFFVGINNAVSMYAEGVPGVRGNCVYWIGGHDGRDQAMVFDMESGRSTPCSVPPPPVGSLPRHPYSSTIFWFFLERGL